LAFLQRFITNGISIHFSSILSS